MANAANNPIHATHTAIQTLIIAGGSYVQREQQIATAIEQDRDQFVAVILEGLPNGSPLIQSDKQLMIERIAPGCFCCVGQLVLQVSLNRVIRKKPHKLYIGMHDAQHVVLLYQRLSKLPYQTLLTIENVFNLS
jgi:hypothetical protein